ncbi:hypothetical protein [Pedobacter sp. V48]|uniref:hypothetical protein n=1 Tax=Pedobacter sp. V48 TaxID=509635 RepID=UPI0003E4ABA1|nr:hypothetical protein [Pedobacter sp. V48]ETZ20177.1 hypothetical protein N824_08160 [Pedobacter sp. V48]
MGSYPNSVKMTPEQRKQGDFNRLMPIITEALLQKVWLYHKKFGCWYTPEEFTKEYSRRFINNYEVEQLLANVVLRDPRSGNNAFQKAILQKTADYQKELADLTRKGEGFLNKVIDYYRDKNTGL